MKIGDNIPPEIAAKLDESLARVRTILKFRGLAVVVAVAVAALLAIMAIDAMVTIFSAGVRWGLWLAALAGIGATAWYALVKPLRRKFTAAEIAALIERNHPELEERLSTVVELAEAGAAEDSRELLAALTVDAVKDAGAVSPKTEFTNRTIKPRLVAAGVTVGILALLFVVFPKATARLAARALVPSAEVDNLYASALEVTPGDKVLLAGSPFTVSLTVEGGFPEKAYVRTRIEGGSETVERMNRVATTEAGAAVYEFAYPQVERSFTYRVNCGNALTRGYSVTVVEEPSYSARAIELVHPAYTGRAGDFYTNTAAIVGLAGTKVRVSVKPSRKGLSGLAVLPKGRTVEAVEESDGRFAFAFELEEGGDGAWGIRLWDDNGFSNRFDTASVTVVKDTPPAISVTDPEASEVKLPVTGELPLGFEIKEDFGVSKVAVEMNAGSPEWTEVVAPPLERTDAVTWTGRTLIRFAGLDFGHADRVRFRLKALDTLPRELGGPGRGLSREITVRLVSENTSLARQALEEQLREADRTMDEAIRTLEQAKNDLRRAEDRYEKSDNPWERDAAKRDLDEAASRIANAEGLMETLAKNLEESKLAAAAEELKKAVEKTVDPLREKTEDIYMKPEDSSRSEPAGEARQAAEKAVDEVKSAKREFDRLAKEAINMQKLEDYARREEALADRAERGEISYQDLAKQEESLERRFNEDFGRELTKNLDSQRSRTEQLERKMSELAQRQTDLDRRAAEAAIKTPEERMQISEDQKRLAGDIERAANETESLANSIEEMTGSRERDENRTAEPMRESAREQHSAAESARQAADQAREMNHPEARKSMAKTQSALAEAAKKLAETKERLAAKQSEFSEESKKYREMGDALHEAVDKARAAAREEAERKAAEAQGEGNERGEGEKTDREGEGEKRQGEGEKTDREGEGEKHQGEGEQMQGQQQSSRQGEKQPGGKPRGGGKNQGEQTQQQRQATESARKAAEQFKERARQVAAREEIPIEPFEQSDGESSEDDSEDSDEDSMQSGKSKGGKSGKPKPSGRSPRGVKRDASQDPDGILDWFRMKSASGSKAETETFEDVPEEYRGLVKEYFRALDEGGAK